MRIRTFTEDDQDDYDKPQVMSPLKALEHETADTKLKTGGIASAKKGGAQAAGKHAETQAASQQEVTPGKPAPKLTKAAARKQKIN